MHLIRYLYLISTEEMKRRIRRRNKKKNKKKTLDINNDRAPLNMTHAVFFLMLKWKIKIITIITITTRSRRRR